MKAVVHRVVSALPDIAPDIGPGITIDEIDISRDSILLARYELEIPVLLIDGRKVAKYRVTEAELGRMLRGPG